MNSLASIILVVALLQFTTGSARTIDTPENKPKFYIYFGQLQELSDYDSFKISANTLTFYGGAKMAPVKSEVHNDLFSDSLYPLMTPWLNDSLVKTVIGVPIGRKRYSKQSVQTVLSGKFSQLALDTKTNKLLWIRFEYPRIIQKAGIVQLNSGEYFIMN